MTNTTIEKIVLSPDQQSAKDRIMSWWKDKKHPVITMGGFAGTGKTTTIASTLKYLQKKNKEAVVAFCCFTGKASSVLRGKLKTAGVEPSYCGTIHAMIYRPILGEHGQIIGWKKVDVLEIDGEPVDLIVVDETSMVSKIIWDDLNSFKIPILAVGDHGQLPPINEEMNLMKNPDIKLEKIHRQAEDNPIIKLSLVVRETGRIPLGEQGPGVVKIKGGLPDLEKVGDYIEAMVLCGFNSTRVAVNRYIRERLGIKSVEPIANDKVICLKNNRTKEIYNGMGGVIVDIRQDGEHWYSATINMDGTYQFRGRILRKQFNSQYTIKELGNLHTSKELKDQFDFGYCLTVHKAQGSEADNVAVVEERLPKSSDENWRRWLYTAVTRAKKRLLVIGQ